MTLPEYYPNAELYRSLGKTKDNFKIKVGLNNKQPIQNYLEDVLAYRNLSTWAACINEQQKSKRNDRLPCGIGGLIYLKWLLYKHAFSHALELIEYRYGSDITGLIECIGVSFMGMNRDRVSNSRINKHTQSPL